MLPDRLNKLLRRREPLPKEVEGAIAKLGRLAEQQPDLRELAETNARLLETMYGHPVPLPSPNFDPAHAATKREAGLPLLRGEALSFDERALQSQFARLCRVMHEHGNQFAGDLLRATEGRTFPVAALAVDVISGDPHAVSARADELGLDAGLAATLLRLTLFPAMARLQAELRPLLDSSSWNRGYCPVCGAWPLLGEYRGLELTRFLRCGLCAAEWQLDRLVCPFCDNRFHQDLTHIGVEGENQKQRAVTCERCHCYIKQISTLGAIPAPELLVVDIQTLHLDLIALQRNYLPPS